MADQLSGYDAFFSYSHRLDAPLTTRLQTGVQRFAKPWYRLRALRAFRDETSLAASPHLWVAIEEALSSSRWMVLMASPDSARSQWVGREIAWWREHRSIDHLLIVVTDGDLVWDDATGDLNWNRTTALSREALAHTFRQEPKWVDMRWARHTNDGLRLTDPRLQGVVADLAATIRHVPKDSLIGEHLRQHRKARRIATTAVVSLVVLLAASIAAAFVAKNQSDRATQQATIAEAGLLAATARSLTGSRLDLAQLFAVKGYQLHPDAQTRSALYSTVQADPHLVGFLQARGTVSALDTSADGVALAVGTTSGLVQRWNLHDLQGAVIARLGRPVIGVSVSANGDTIGAIGRSRALVWRAGSGVRSFPAGRGSALTAIGISASGRFAVLAAGSRLWCINLGTGAVVAEQGARSPISKIAISGDSQAVTFDSELGQWYRLSIPGLRKVDSYFGYFGVQKYATAISPTGRYITYNNGGSRVQVWVTHHTVSGLPKPELTAATGASFPTALALSRDGRWVAATDTSALYVSRTTPGGRQAAAPVVLRGGGYFARKPLAFNAVAFAGPTGSRLVSSSGNLLALWDLSQHSRIADQAHLRLPVACEHCGRPYLTVLPDNKTALVLVQGPTGSYFTPVRLEDPPRVGQQRIPYQGLPMVWGRNGNKNHYFPGSLAASLSQDGRRIVEVRSDGTILLRDPATNRVLSTITPPHTTYAAEAAIDARGENVALVSYPPSRVQVVHIPTRSRHEIPGSISGIGYSGEVLLIQHASGALEVRSADGRKAIRQIEVGSDPLGGPVANRSGLAVIQKQDGAAVIADIKAGSVVGAFVLPSGPRGSQSTGMAFTPDGDWLVLATEGRDPGDIGAFTRVNMSYRAWTSVACATSGHSLTPGEWRKYTSLAVPGDLRCGAR